VFSLYRQASNRAHAAR